MKFLRFLSLVLIVSLSLLASSSASAFQVQDPSKLSSPNAAVPGAPTTYDFSKVHELLGDAVSSNKVAGISLLLIHRGKVVFQEAFGQLDIESRVPFTTDSIVNLDSSTKWISATAMMMLVDDRKIALDDPISKYFSEFANLPVQGAAGEKANPTFRQCFSHTAGFAEQTPELGFPELTLRESAAAIFKSQPELVAKPGTEFRYGGVSYQVAGAVIERVSGMSFEEFLRKRIFTQLGMNDTTFNPYGDQLRRTGPVYSPQADGSFHIVSLPPDGQNRNSRVAGGLYSTLSDYGHFLELQWRNGRFRNLQLLAPETAVALRTDQTHGLRYVDSPNGTMPYGLGVWLNEMDAQGMGTSVSVGGAFGTYPWVDYHRELIGVLFTQTPLAQCKDLVEKAIPTAARAAIDAGPPPPLRPEVERPARRVPIPQQ
jgi:CubicO group peptidase (beta-lactamase class C family)